MVNPRDKAGNAEEEEGEEEEEEKEEEEEEKEEEETKATPPTNILGSAHTRLRGPISAETMSPTARATRYDGMGWRRRK